jgi:hypothetical protein
MKRICVNGALTVSLLVAGSIVGAPLAWSADGNDGHYRPDDFLTLNLSQAVLSPQPLGPPAHFEPYGIEARNDGQTTDDQVGAKTEAKTETTPTEETAPAEDKTADAAESKTAAAPPARTARVHHPRKLAVRKHSNPLDAQALDSRGLRQHGRVQVWPCRSGGICDWTNSN